MNPFAKHIANALSISEHQVEATLKLLDEGCTIPFIARYRKERTGNLDEVQITRISELNAQLKELEKRKATILKTIAEQEKLTPELERRIRNCWNATELEDIYLPFKPRRRTRAQVAREQGLEPLATILLLQREANPAQAAKRFVKGDVADVEAALAGAKDIIADEEPVEDRLRRQFVRGHGACQSLVGEAVEDAFRRLIDPSIENEFTALSKEKADEEAIHVFAENLRQLLLSAPLGQKRVMAIDPGFANGCKIACLDAQGNLLHHEILYPHPPKRHRAQATVAAARMVKDFAIEAIAIGNGTASRETRDFVDEMLDYNPALPEVSVFTVSEDGASIYSASPTAREEFPDEDVTTRGAVSIGRRLMDPLAELVKIDPKSIGVGQYQHDVDQAKLKHSLDRTVESCVNLVGVNVNTASKHLLMYVSGLGPALAQNIVDYRREHGAFTSRAQLRKVPRLGPAAYQQCAGFLRIPGAKNPLDNSAVHPESYAIVERMAADEGCTVAQLVADKQKQRQIDVKRYVTSTVGLPTLNDILAELEKPGRDPRQPIQEFRFSDSVHTIDDLGEGMELPGIVTNITNFGAFVDIGVHQDGLVHISQLADKFVKDPNEVVKLHQQVMVRVTEVDLRRGRIALSMRKVKQP